MLVAVDEAGSERPLVPVDLVRGDRRLALDRRLGGDRPRSFNIDPTGGYLIALLQRSNFIAPLRIDPETGKLSRAGDTIATPTPVCAKFLELA